jgi:aerobic carbon-monoxide dehydrogenase medium subunit
MSYAFKDFHWTRHIPVKDYFLPKTLTEALEILAESQGRALVVAGGTDVIPQLRRRDLDADALVDITHLPDMRSIEESGERIVLGGLVTHAAIASSSLVREKAKLLADGAECLGSPQIRNVATVAGNLVSGQPAADTSTPLLALNASVILASQDGERVVPLTKFFLDTGKTILDGRREILTRIEFNALKEHHGCCYLRLSQRKALALPILVCGVLVKVDKKRRVIQEAAVALGPVAPIPLRVTRVEEALRDRPINKETIEAAGAIAREECNPRDSLLRGSSLYRKEMAKVFVKRGLQKALAQVGLPVT